MEEGFRKCNFSSLIKYTRSLPALKLPTRPIDLNRRREKRIRQLGNGCLGGGIGLTFELGAFRSQYDDTKLGPETSDALSMFSM